MKNVLVSLMLVSVATLTSAAHADDCGTSDRVPLPACAKSGKVQGSSAGFFVHNTCWHPITVKFDKAGGDVRTDIPPGKQIEQTPLPPDTKIACCPRYNSCADETTPPSPTAGLTCGKQVRIKSFKGAYLTRITTGTGLALGAASTDSVWTVVCANNKVQLKSSKGDFLHRPDSKQGVTTYSTGTGNEWTTVVVSGKVQLKSWKGDFLHGAEGPGVTTWDAGDGNNWTVETL